MRATTLIFASLLVTAGCYYTPPQQQVVQREVVDPNGNVVEQQTVVEDEPGPPPPVRVEVMPVRPYPDAVWVRGYWFRNRRFHRWEWVPGRWR